MGFKAALFIVLLACCSVAAAVEQMQPAGQDGASAQLEEQFNVVTSQGENSSFVFKSLSQLDELTQLGVPGLALRIIEQQQSLYSTFTPDWYAFEFKRVRTLASLEQWDKVAERSRKVLNEAKPGVQITPRIENWFKTQLAIAALKQGEATTTLALCREMLWNNGEQNTSMNPLWRRLIIRAYLQQGLVDDARKSLLKYRRDYGEYKSEWKVLQARALLKAGRPEEVIGLLEGEESHEAQALRLIAAVRSRPENISLYIEDVKRNLDDEALSKSRKREYQYVLYEAYTTKKDSLSAALAAEQLLALSRAYTPLGEDFSINGDTLWSLYQHIGERTGNHYNLLKGDDTAWYNQAGKIQKPAPVRARGMYAVLAFNAQDEVKRQLAHKEIVTSLAKTDGGLEVINQLYLQSDQAGSPQDLPVEVRFRLVDYALSIADVSLAATIMSSLPAPPEGKEEFGWQMRKARVLILEGDHEQGEAVLKKAITNNAELDADKVDSYLQVVFDLQTIKRHEQALELFNLLPEDKMEDKLRRELYYWKAESSAELGRYDQAALLYLTSARTVDDTMMDLWAQSARFKAADALLKAELYDDAKHAYSELLAITVNDSRKRLIRQKLQHIRLLRNAGGRSNEADSNKVSGKY